MADNPAPLSLYTSRLKAQIEADPRLKVFVGKVPGTAADAPTGYVLLFPSFPEDSSDRLGGRVSDESVEWGMNVCGQSVAEADDLAGRVRARLRNVVLQVPGRNSFPIERAWSDPMQVDRSTTPHIFFYPTRWVWKTTPA